MSQNQKITNARIRLGKSLLKRFDHLLAGTPAVDRRQLLIDIFTFFNTARVLRGEAPIEVPKPQAATAQRSTEDVEAAVEQLRHLRNMIAISVRADDVQVEAYEGEESGEPPAPNLVATI